jgi:hypothetical protein
MKTINTTNTISEIELNSMKILIECIIDELISNGSMDRYSFNKRVESEVENSMYVNTIMDIRNTINTSQRHFLNTNTIGES